MTDQGDRSITPDDEARMVELRRSKQTLDEIGRKYGVSRAEVLAILKKHGEQ